MMDIQTQEQLKKIMKENEECLHRLLQLWYKIIGPQHHKDRDCHFFIERHYCTYKDPVWTVRHHGYILKDFDEEFKTFNLALQGLITFLISKIAEEIHYMIDDEDLGTPKEQIQSLQLEYRTELEKIVSDVSWTPSNIL